MYSLYKLTCNKQSIEPKYAEMLMHEKLEKGTFRKNNNHEMCMVFNILPFIDQGLRTQQKGSEQYEEQTRIYFSFQNQKWHGNIWV